METRHRTTLEVKGGARDVHALDQTLTNTFSPKKAEGFERSMRALNRAMESLKRTVEAASQSAEHGFRRMETAARSARAEVDRLLQASGGTPGSGGVADAVAGGGGGGAGSSMFRRMARSRIPMPSAGAIGTALAGIPVAGLLAAGGLMAASGSYGSHLSWQQAQMQKMMRFLPFVFLFLLYNYASGLSLYMTTSALIPIVQYKFLKITTPTA